VKVHEYQAKALMAEFGIPVPQGGVASAPEEAQKVAERLGGRVVVKAQAHAGGRGKGGGIKLADSPQQAAEIASTLLGSRLVTPQTTAEGVPVSRVLVEQASPIQQELYLSIAVQGGTPFPVMIASPAGGMDIEEVARTAPEKIHRVLADPATGFQPFMGRQLAYGLGLSGDLFRQATGLMDGLYRLFMAKDCSLAEINPLVVTGEGKLVALDAKLDFDDNALYRHPELNELHDPEQDELLEVQAVSLGLRNYVKLDGNIGCMINGAGLAMSVLDIINLAGGSAANFLDIGTVNNSDRVVSAFKVFLMDSDVKGVLINIFGGMARADVIATGLVDAYRSLSFTIPVVVRLAGTNVEEGKHIISESGIPVIMAVDLADAAQKVVAAVKEAW
jgi:succinyl-CoA synthetase beta subunit